MNKIKSTQPNRPCLHEKLYGVYLQLQPRTPLALDPIPVLSLRLLRSQQISNRNVRRRTKMLLSNHLQILSEGPKPNRHWHLALLCSLIHRRVRYIPNICRRWLLNLEIVVVGCTDRLLDLWRGGIALSWCTSGV